MNLVVHHGALGDFVLTFPLLRSLAPARTIVVAAPSKAKLAARLHPHVEAMSIEVPPWSRLHGAGDCAIALPAVERVFSFVSTGRDAWAANVRAALPEAQIHFIEPRPPVGWKRHVCDWHEQQLREQGWDRPGEPAPPRGKVAGPIVIHPGSGGRDKCWPLPRYEKLIAQLRAAARPVLPVIGEVELERWKDGDVKHWREELGAEVVSSLDELCDVLQSAGGFIGNDSGPTHLAAQLGVPTLALFGPTDADVWSPRGPTVTAMRPPTMCAMDWLSADAVREMSRTAL